jgi:hypothetical protein
VADPLNNLAKLYQEQSKYVEAESLILRALRICEQAHGSQHPEIAETMHDFAWLQEAQGNNEKARS